MNRISRQMTCLIDPPEIHSPRIDSNPVKLGDTRPAADPKRFNHIRPQGKKIPMQPIP
jgi:hypothetical protein